MNAWSKRDAYASNWMAKSRERPKYILYNKPKKKTSFHCRLMRFLSQCTTPPFLFLQDNYFYFEILFSLHIFLEFKVFGMILKFN
jgi:hypothetical protein